MEVFKKSASEKIELISYEGMPRCFIKNDPRNARPMIEIGKQHFRKITARQGLSVVIFTDYDALTGKMKTGVRIEHDCTTVPKEILMLKSVTAGPNFNLRTGSFFVNDIQRLWSQLRRNRDTRPWSNPEMVRQTCVVEYCRDSDDIKTAEFKMLRCKTIFGDHQRLYDNLLLDNRDVKSDFQVVQILSAWLETWCRKYLDRISNVDSGRVDRYVNEMKTVIFNPRKSVLSEMSHDDLAECERNWQYVLERQRQLDIFAFPDSYLQRYVNKIKEESINRRNALLAIPQHLPPVITYDKIVRSFHKNNTAPMDFRQHLQDNVIAGYKIHHKTVFPDVEIIDF